MKYGIIGSFFLCSVLLQAQFSEVQVIDAGIETGATTHITSADMNNDGFTDLLLSRAGNQDQITVYYNQSNASFSRVMIDNSINDPVFVNVGDFDDNGFLDVIALTETGGDVMLYLNDANGFSAPVTLGTEASFGKSIAVDDFDNDGWLDAVVIHQHAIAYYHNLGNAIFQKQPILTTAESPHILECFDLVNMDVNGDGFIDLVTAETIGVVLYTNDGTGNFTPETITPASQQTVMNVQKIDFDNDGLDDLVFLDGNSQLRLYKNASATTTTFTEHSAIAQIQTNSVKALRSIDQNGDALPDLYLAYGGQPRVMLNDSNHDFSQSIILDDQPELFVQEIHVADLTNDGIYEFIWESAGGTLAYQSNTTLNVSETSKVDFKIYPNPTSKILQIETETVQNGKLSLYHLNGIRLRQFEIDLPGQIDVKELAKGHYILSIETKRGRYFKTIIKN